MYLLITEIPILILSLCLSTPSIEKKYTNRNVNVFLRFRDYNCYNLEANLITVPLQSLTGSILRMPIIIFEKQHYESSKSK
ncbi:hypothetical protein SAMN05660445_01393 [Salegentibacter salarius]|nr:hypothetical protein SAMN05660445_01393 [Salegentibacter salarius]